jgi:VanZ family protein
VDPRVQPGGSGRRFRPKVQDSDRFGCNADRVLEFTINLLFATVLGALALLGLGRALDPRRLGRGWAVFFVVVWAASVAFMTLRPGSGLGMRLNLVPLRVDGPGTVVDVVLNVGVFVPLGIVLALRHVRFRSTLLIALGSTLFIEVTQYLSNVGRTADVNDLITNTTGACVGWALACSVQLLADRFRLRAAEVRTSSRPR